MRGVNRPRAIRGNGRESRPRIASGRVYSASSKFPLLLGEILSCRRRIAERRGEKVQIARVRGSRAGQRREHRAKRESASPRRDAWRPTGGRPRRLAHRRRPRTPARRTTAFGPRRPTAAATLAPRREPLTSRRPIRRCRSWRELRQQPHGPRHVLRLVLWLRRPAHRAAQGEIGGRKRVFGLFLLQRRAEVLVGLVVALQAGEETGRGRSLAMSPLAPSPPTAC